MTAGRPREFDIDQALDRALKVFWRKGFEGATLTDLTKAMRISRPSLYAAFGNKEALFRRAIDRYSEGPSSPVRDALAQPTARAVVEQLLRGSVERITDPRNPPGCFLVQGALACSDSAAPLRREMAKRRDAGVELLRERFQRAVDEGDLLPDTDPADLARYVATVMHGLAVQAAGGVPRSELERVVRIACCAWPS